MPRIGISSCFQKRQVYQQISLTPQSASALQAISHSHRPITPKACSAPLAGGIISFSAVTKPSTLQWEYLVEICSPTWKNPETGGDLLRKLPFWSMISQQNLTQCSTSAFKTWCKLVLILFLAHHHNNHLHHNNANKNNDNNNNNNSHHHHHHHNLNNSSNNNNID